MRTSRRKASVRKNMGTKLQSLSAHSASLFKAALLTGAIALAALATVERAQADSGLCAAGSDCGSDLLEASANKRVYRYSMALQRTSGPEGGLRRGELSDQDFSSFSGVGVVVCSVNGQSRSSNAFLVGAFDIGVTVAHTFEFDNAGEPAECVYNSMDSLGQVRERIPVSYIKSQWDAEAGAFGQPAKDFAVIRLSKPSRYAQRTMPLGRFSGAAAPVVMVGFKSDDADTVKRKARGTVYERRADGIVASGVAGFTHDMDSRGIAAGAPVIDERSGVIIGIHTPLATSRNTMITMNDWLEDTLRAEMEAQVEKRVTVN